jgi:uncharacterized protein (DUF305 family)
MLSSSPAKIHEPRVTGVSPDPRTGDSPRKLRNTRGLSGNAFDREFLTSMTSHHQGAIDTARAEQANGHYEPAKTLAANIIRTQTEEIATMAELLKAAQ